MLCISFTHLIVINGMDGNKTYEYDFSQCWSKSNGTSFPLVPALCSCRLTLCSARGCLKGAVKRSSTLTLLPGLQEDPLHRATVCSHRWCSTPQPEAAFVRLWWWRASQVCFHSEHECFVSWDGSSVGSSCLGEHLVKANNKLLSLLCFWVRKQHWPASDAAIKKTAMTLVQRSFLCCFQSLKKMKPPHTTSLGGTSISACHGRSRGQKGVWPAFRHFGLQTSK